MKVSSTKCKYRARKDASAVDRDGTWKGAKSLTVSTGEGLTTFTSAQPKPKHTNRAKLA
jgi:hypothetical protein